METKFVAQDKGPPHLCKQRRPCTPAAPHAESQRARLTGQARGRRGGRYLRHLGGGLLRALGLPESAGDPGSWSDGTQHTLTVLFPLWLSPRPGILQRGQRVPQSSGSPLRLPPLPQTCPEAVQRAREVAVAPGSQWPGQAGRGHLCTHRMDSIEKGPSRPTSLDGE